MIKKPGSRGGAKHKEKVEQRINELKDQNYEHLKGGLTRQEETVEIKNGFKTLRRPDVTMRAPDGTIYRENIGKSTLDGRPIARERRALDDLRSTGCSCGYTPYDR